MAGSFEDRQKELCQLSSFISEQQEWLDNWLSALGWSAESLQNPKAPKVSQCPHNPNHYVPSDCLEEHQKKCQYACLLNTNMREVDWDEIDELRTEPSFLYHDSPTIESIVIGKPVEEAVKKLASDLPEIERVSRQREQHKMQEQFSSLEETQPTPLASQFQDPSQLISYIKSWKKVPSDFAQVETSTLNLAKVKGWLFENLPKRHAHSSSLGGEITMVDSIMACLSPPSAGVNRNVRPVLSPNFLTNKLQPLLGLNARSLVLALWKFLHISQLQKEHGLTESFVSEIVPMPQSAVQGLASDGSQGDPTLPSIADLVTGLMKSDNIPLGHVDTPTSEEVPLPLPPTHSLDEMTTLERRVLYDYAVEVTSRQAFMKLDPELYRDDMAIIKAKLKAQAKLEATSAKKEDVTEVETKGKTYLQLLKEKRDYKRRRQKYRARNVHITRRTPTEIFRTIINNRMEELGASLSDAEDNSEPGPKERPGTPDEAAPSERKPRRESRSRERDRGERGRELSRSSGRRDHRRKHRRSRSRRRSRRERSGSRSRRSRSRSRKRKRKSRSRSRERTHKHKKHRKRSRSKS